jgi:hypothetical protein
MSIYGNDIFVEVDGLAGGHEKVKSFAGGRVCAEPGCGTILSIYNSADSCCRHGRVEPAPLVNRGERSHRSRRANATARAVSKAA